MKTTHLPVGTSAPLASYIRRVRQIETLSRQQEYEIADEWWRTGDRNAADRLIRANLRYVVAVALSFRHYGLSLSDLIAEGNYGLAYALTKFNPARGTRFVTYATYWIRAYILNYVIYSWSLVGAGSGPLRSKLFFRLRREWARAENLVGDKQEAARLLGERLGEPEDKVRAMTERLEMRDVSLDTVLFDDSGTTMLDTLVSEGVNQEEAISKEQERERMEQSVYGALDELDPRERFIVESRLMADYEDMLSLADIGRKLGVSRERARQLEARAKRKLQERLDHLRDYQRAA